MTHKIAVIAIGGNSLIKDSKHQTVEDQYLAAKETESEKLPQLPRKYRRVYMSLGLSTSEWASSQACDVVGKRGRVARRTKLVQGRQGTGR